ncbi:MAG TPA: DMT family transporter [Thermoplasmata archaeon]|nr:DMT family transporter [Thermoplasmata archaeon]
MSDPRGRLVGASLLALGAAFLWASYYPLVLKYAAGATPIEVLAWPFVVGGAAFVGLATFQGHGSAVGALYRDRGAWVRLGLLLGMQAAVLASTYLAGAVDTSLLSLLGDVVATPILLVLIFSEGAGRIRSPSFLTGIVVCTAGAVLTIAAGGAIRPLTAVSLPIGVLVPVVIGLYFLLMARASRSVPLAAVVGQVTVTAGLLLLIAGLADPAATGSLIPDGAGPAIALAAIGLTSFFLGPALYFLAIERAGLVLPAVLMATIPVFTLLLSWLLLGAVPPVLGLAGIPIAVGGALWALRGEHAPWTPSYGSGA